MGISAKEFVKIQFEIEIVHLSKFKFFDLDSMIGRDHVLPMKEQIEKYSALIRDVTDRHGDITLVGFDQGALIARAVLQMSDNPHIHTLISLAAPGNWIKFHILLALVFEWNFHLIQLDDFF